jgi:hypothetical protein
MLASRARQPIGEMPQRLPAHQLKSFIILAQQYIRPAKDLLMRNSRPTPILLLDGKYSPSSFIPILLPHKNPSFKKSTVIIVGFPYINEIMFQGFAMRRCLA